MSGAFHELVADLAALNVQMRLGPSGELLVDAPPRALDASLKERISANKPEFLRMLQSYSVSADAGRITPIDTREGDVQASFAQEGLWLHGRFSGGDSYNIPFVLRVHGSLDVALLERALAAVGQRHEALRTTFSFDGSGLRQRLAAGFESGLVTHDLSQLASAPQERALEEALARLAGEPFDLENGPLHRCRLFKVAESVHIFSLVIHHIAFDHWSRGPLARDLVAFYAALSADAHAVLPALPVQYRDYAAWQRRRLEGPHGQQQLSYWTEELRDAPPLLSLPTDRPRRPLSASRGAKVLFTLGREQTNALAALAGREGATLFMLLEAAFAVLMNRYSAQDDVCVGTPVAGRSRLELEGLIGLFVNTVVLRNRVDGNEPFNRLLARVRHTVLQAFAHQDLPFDKLVQELKPVRSAELTPLFQVMFALQNTPTVSLQAVGLAFELLASPPRSAKFDLVWTLSEHEGQLFGRIEYSTDLFDEATVQRMAKHYEVLLEGICADPNTKVQDLPLLTPEEERQILVEWNDTAAEYPKDQAIHQLFEEQVRRRPDAVAVVYEGEQLTYGELNARANQLAHHLRGLGVGPEVLVGICVERSLEMVVGLLGILKAGGAYVPLDPAYPGERLAFMLEDAAPRVLLTQQRLLGQLPPCEAQVLCLDRDWAQVDSQASHDLENLTGPENLAYVIYTSGSTGQPKGVGNVHHAIVNRLKWMQNAYGLQPQDTVVQKTPFSFDVSVWEFFWTLLYGARLVVARPEGHKDADYLLQLMQQERVSTAHFVPTMLDVFLRALGARRSPQSLRTVVCSGEALPLELQERFFAQMGPGARLHNLYGPTEAAVDVSYWECRSDAGLPTVPIGRPIANTQLYILDSHLRPVPVGVAGELHIGGAGLARGYLNKPELTAQRFIANPFDEPGSRLYKTGDLAKYLPDGNIEYLGRMDNQVKLRGFRIELGEIESVLQQYAEVAQAVVVVREDEPGDKRLVAYFVGKGEASIRPIELRSHLQARLPEYMVPAAFVQLAQVPLSPNGKVDRKALPVPDGQRMAAQDYVEPTTPIQKKLAAIWAEVLKVERVGLHDNFFELGGHSLRAVTLMERMRREGFTADIRDVFVASTLGALATQLEAAQPAQDVEIPPNPLHEMVDAITPAMLPLVQLTQAEIDTIVARVPGGVRNIQDIYPLAPLQQGILFHHLMADRGDPYVLCTVLAVERREAIQDVLHALQAAIDRHDILRTAVLWEGLREPVQVVHRHTLLAVEEIELDSALEDGEPQLRARFDPEEYRMDVRRAPMLHAAVARNGDHWLLLLLCHHLVEDYTSLRLLHAEVRQQLAGRADRLPSPFPFRNFVARARLGVSQEEHESFFRHVLAGVEETTAPFGLWEVRGVKGCPLDEHKREIDATLAARLRNAARTLRVSAASFFHLAWALVLARTSGRDDVVFGTVLFGRMLGEQGADRSLGLFINTLPLRVKVDDRGAQRALREVHDQLAHLLRHEHAPLVLAQQASGIPPATPLFTSLLNYRHRLRTSGDETLSAPSGMRMLRSEERTNYPLKLAIDDDGEAFRLSVQVARTVVASNVCDLMEAALAELVQALANSPETAVIGLNILPSAQAERQLCAWNATQAPYPRDQAIHQLFEEQVRRRPDAVAVVYEGEQLTYGELNARANQLAHHLRGLGVGPEVLVGICVERSLEMVVGLLGVLKAGGAYVPLDPGYPQERLAHMLQDAAPRVLLTQQRLLGQLPSCEAQVLCLDRDWAQVDSHASHDLENLTGPENLAYVTYTSGSTGQPKGVMTHQQGVVNYLHFVRTVYEVTPTDRILQIPTLAFDASVRDILGTLLSGAALYLLTSVQAKSAQDIRARLHGSACTAILSITPSLLEQVAAASNEGLPFMRVVLASGEVLSAGICESVAQRMGRHVKVVNQYGPTECTMTTSYFCVQAGEPICVGRPIANARMYILDAKLRPVPIGVPGELHIGGAGLARGYLNKPELTAQKFIANPLDEPGSRLYKTGDLARYLPDGNIEYLGRMDNQVKLRGFRIELGEIESVLQQHAEVAQAVVVVREDQPGDKRLVAYVVGRDQQGVDVQQLRSVLKAKLPEYAVPAAYVQLAQLPLTSNGKVDRKALPAPGGQRQSSNEYVEPRSPTEQVLAAIWAQVLKVDLVGLSDNFFELGGHSLLATRVASQVAQTLGREVPLRAMFEYGELQALARHLDEIGPQGRELSPIPVLLRDGSMPLSYAQQRLWFLDQFDKAQASYNIPIALRLLGAGVDLDAVQATFDQLVERHETLRTVFEVHAGEPRQVIRPVERLDIHFEDLGEVDGSALKECTEAFITRAAVEPFDLERGPLVRLTLLRLAPEEHILLLTLHHIISDGWSLAVLVREFAKLYEGRRLGLPVNLAPLRIQYADYAVWQRQRLQGEFMQQQLAYWKRQLQGAPALLDLPTDRPRPPVLTHQGGSVSFSLGADLTSRVKGLARAEGATLFMVLQAGFALLLHRCSGQDDICVGTPVAGRNRADLEGLVGFFVNMIVLRLNIEPQASFRVLLAQAKQAALEAYVHQEVPFDQLVDELKPPRSPRYSPLIQVMFGLQNAPMESLQLQGIRFETLRTHTTGAKFDLTCILAEREGRIGGNLEYNAALFNRSSVEIFAQSYVQLLASACLRPDASVSALVMRPSIALPGLLPEIDAEVGSLSYHQERLWFIDAFEARKLYGANPTYHNVPLILALPFACEQGALAAALNTLLKRHAALRACFISEGGLPRKRYSAARSVPFKVRVIERGGEIAAAREEALRPFDIDGDLMVRAVLLRNDEGSGALVLVAHHLVVDRTSMQVIASELAELIAAHRQGREPRLSAAPASYEQHVQWQRRLLENHGALYFPYWRRQLRAPLAALQLPLSRPRPAVHTYTGGQHQFLLGSQVASQVRELARREGCAPFDALAAAFAVLLHRYTGQEEIVFGTRWDGRSLPNLKQTVGPISNLLVLRARLMPDDSFAELAAQFRRLHMEAVEYGEMQFDQLVLKLRPDKDMSRTALFDVLFEVTEEAEVLPEGIRCLETNMGYGKYDLHVHMQFEDQGLAVSVSYNRDLFDDALMHRMMRHLESVVVAMGSDGAQHIGAPALLSAAEVEEQLDHAEVLPPAQVEARAIHEIFEEVAVATPDAIALTCAGDEITYAQLNRRANRLARELLARGLTVEGRVALFLPPSTELVVAMLAVLKAGGCYVPLDLEHPDDRVGFMVEDSGCRQVVTLADYAQKPVFAGLDRLLMDAAAPAADDATNLELPVPASRAMYVIYTSGSTGRPKGAVLEHRNVAHLVLGSRSCFAFGPTDAWSLFHSSAFDFSVWEIYGALLLGGRIVVVPPAVRRDPRQLLRLLVAERVTVLNQTPTAFYNLQRELAEVGAPELGFLRYVIFGGEALNPSKLAPFLERERNVRMINMYGITETCVHVTFKAISQSDVALGVSNIGVPLPTVHACLLDAQGRLVPKGVVGEIHVGGSGVCRGYLNRSDLNAERFIQHPYRPGELLYRSGDLARLTEDGDLIYVGRKDKQVKVRGYRIETGEIEAALVGLPEVADTFVLTIGEGSEQAMLVAYVVPAEGEWIASELSERLRFAARQFLPEYMVPGRFLFVDRLPLNANGKIDIAQLPSPDAAGSEQQYVAPTSETEAELARIWASVLNVERVGIHDNFFSLGGHSLLATQVISRIRDRWRLDLPLRFLFESPTVALLSMRIEQEELDQESVEI